MKLALFETNGITYLAKLQGKEVLHAVEAYEVNKVPITNEDLDRYILAQSRGMLPTIVCTDEPTITQLKPANHARVRYAEALLGEAKETARLLLPEMTQKFYRQLLGKP